MKSVVFLTPFLTAAYGHGIITAITGANGVTISGFGITNDAVPRNGTSEQPFQIDTPVMKNLKDDPCGATLQSGSINIEKSFQTALQQGKGQLPSVNADGSITMTIHQVNADGGGPYTAQFNTDGTGKEWQNAKVTQQVPGANGIVRGGPVDSQFTAVLPAGTKCTGGPNKDACIIRINNGGAGLEQSIANGAGPFGGCVPVTTGGNGAQGGAGAGNQGATQANQGGVAVPGQTLPNQNQNQNQNQNNGGQATNQGGVAIPGRPFPNQNNAGRGGRRGGRRQRQQPRRAHQRDFRREERRGEIEERNVDDEMSMGDLHKRQLLTFELINELQTATGSAIDIPIDALAGEIDADPLGGNSTEVEGAILTKQQATDLKKAVQEAIRAAFSVVSSAKGVSVDAPGFNVKGKLTPEAIDQANREAADRIAKGLTTSINQGNAGVGEPNTAVVDGLLGPLTAVKALTLTTLKDGSAATQTAGNGKAENTNSPVATATPTTLAQEATATQVTQSSVVGNNGNAKATLTQTAKATVFTDAV